MTPRDDGHGPTANKPRAADEPSPSLAKITADWLADRRVTARGDTQRTEQAYRNDLALVAERILRSQGRTDDAGFAMSRLSIAAFDVASVRGALAQLAADGYAEATRARVTSTVRGLYRWLTETGLIDGDPSARLPRWRARERLPSAFSVDELRSILAAAATPDPAAKPAVRWPRRDRALVAVLAGSGIRASECVGLAVSALTRNPASRLRVHGKGGKTRTVPVPQEVVDAVDDYLADRGEKLTSPGPHDPLFVRTNGRALTRQSLYYLVDRWAARAGVDRPDGEAVHAFRHTYARGLVDNGVPVTAVQQLLGHAGLNTTQVYLRMTGSGLHDAVQAAEIRSLLRDVNVHVSPTGVDPSTGENGQRPSRR